MTNTVVFSDIAGTIIEGNPWDYIRTHPNYNQKAGKTQIRLFLPVYALNRLKIISDSTFRDQWLRRMAAALKGMKKETVLNIYQDIAANNIIYRDDVIARLHEHKQQGAKVVLVSGMFIELVEVLAERIGADGAIGSRMEWNNTVATGKVEGLTCVGSRKVDYIKQYLSDNAPNVDTKACYGYADSYSDRSLLGNVGHGVAVYPDDDLRPLAITNGWEIHPA